VTWSSFFTGRAFDLGLTPDRIWMELQLRDLSDDLKRKVFVGQPHTSITYASMPSLVPLGVQKVWGNFTVVGVVGGVVHRLSTTKARLDFSAGTDFIKRVIPSNVRALMNETWQVILTSGGNTGIFPTRPVKAPTGKVSWHDNQPIDYFLSFEIDELPVGSPGYLAMPADLAVVQFYVTRDLPPTADSPLLIGDVHPVQLLADLIDGKFSLLKSDGSARAMAPRANCARWTTGDPWKPLIDDTSFAILPRRHPGERTRERLDREGALSDLPARLSPQRRRPGRADRSPAQREHLVRRHDHGHAPGGARAAWKVSRESAMTGAEVTYYVDEAVSLESVKTLPDPTVPFPPGGVRTTKAGPS
jgi:hypothetical protein